MGLELMTGMLLSRFVDDCTTRPALQGFPRFLDWFPPIFNGFLYFFGAFSRFFGFFPQFFGPIALISNRKILINYENEPKIYGIRSKNH